MIISKEKFLKNIYLAPIILPIILLVSTCIIVSSKKYFWYDELLSYYLVTDKSLLHMFKALADQVDGGPPLYYILVWFWVKLFGGTELSLRLFSCLGICVACIVVYILLYKIYKFWPAFIGTLTVFVGSGLIFRYNFEARFYGLFLAVCSLGIFLYYKVCTTTNKSSKMLILLTLVNAAIVLSHPYGFWYSGVILITLLIRDKYFGIFRKEVYLSILLGWLMFIPWLPAFINQLRILKDDFWIRQPPLLRLYNIYGFEIGHLPLIFIGISFILFLSKGKKSTINSVITPFDDINENQRKIEFSIFLLGYALLTVPALSWFVSKFTKPIFLRRYFLPSCITYSFLVAALFSVSLELLSHINKRRFIISGLENICLVIISAILLRSQLVAAINFKEHPLLDVCKYGYTELPIISAGFYENAVNFLQIFYYSVDKNRFIYLLDKEVSLKESSYYMDKMMAALGRNYLPNNVQQVQEFLLSHNAFLILNSNDWFEARIKNNHGYSFKILDEGKLILVLAN